VEEDCDLRRKWAALLANAASPGPPGKILPGYADVLRQLTPMQARILDVMLDKFPPNVDVPNEWICSECGIGPDDYKLLASDLHRLQLIDGRRTVHSTPHLGAGMSGSLTGSTVVGLTSESHYAAIGLTPFGKGFVLACRAPTPGGSD
jgi:hypothetical protein